MLEPDTVFLRVSARRDQVEFGDAPRIGYKNMNIRPGPSFQDTEELKAPETWVRPNKTTAVLDLLEKLCPKELPCSDVDRAILGASLGG